MPGHPGGGPGVAAGVRPPPGLPQTKGEGGGGAAAEASPPTKMLHQSSGARAAAAFSSPTCTQWAHLPGGCFLTHLLLEVMPRRLGPRGWAASVPALAQGPPGPQLPAGCDFWSPGLRRGTVTGDNALKPRPAPGCGGGAWRLRGWAEAPGPPQRGREEYSLYTVYRNGIYVSPTLPRSHRI